MILRAVLACYCTAERYLPNRAVQNDSLISVLAILARRAHSALSLSCSRICSRLAFDLIVKASLWIRAREACRAPCAPGGHGVYILAQAALHYVFALLIQASEAHRAHCARCSSFIRVGANGALSFILVNPWALEASGALLAVALAFQRVKASRALLHVLVALGRAVVAGRTFIALLMELISELSARTGYRGLSYIENGALKAIWAWFTARLSNVILISPDRARQRLRQW
jgi:hypothetical protein